MKATFDIPDELYRSVKARSALEGRPLRAVAIELFQNWLRGSADTTPEAPEPPTPEELTEFPWLAISQKHVKQGVSSDMDDIRDSVARGWAADGAEKPTSAPATSKP